MHFKSFIITRLKHIFINQNRNHYNQHIFANKKLVYSCSIKICALGFDEFLESIFCLLLGVEVLSLHKVVEMREEVVAGWQEVRWIWLMRQNFETQFIQLLKHWLCNLVGCCCREELDLFCWPVPASGIAVFGASHQFAEPTSQMEWFHQDSEGCSGSDQQ